jgi:uncharacterized membrane protein YgcG
VALTLCLLIGVTVLPLDSDAAVFFQTSSMSSDYSGQGVPLQPEEIQSLVAPIALYPDPLVAQILNAATFPDQIAVASYWLQQNKNLSGSALSTAINGQSWDPSVKALTQFPSVLNNMSQNLAWTSQLGEVYHNQQPDVMSAIQTLRAKAKAAGNLKSTSQITVTPQSGEVIEIEPANPQIVYVPVYNPAVVYGTPVVTPGYSTADVVATGVLSFGAGVAVGALMSGGCCEWGWSSWTCNWYHGGAYYHGYPYYGNNAWHGGYYGGYTRYGNHPYNTNYDYAHPYTAYQSAAYHNDTNAGINRTGDTSIDRNTNVSGNTVNVNRTSDSATDRAAGGWSNSDDVRGWGQGNTRGDSTSAFSSWADHSGSSSFGSGGWGDRSSSSRGWASHGGSGGGWGGGGHAGGGGRR